MSARVYPFPVTVREHPEHDGLLLFAVDVYFVLRLLVALLVGGTGATAIFASVVSVYVLNLDQFLAASAMMIGFGLLGIGFLIGGFALREWNRIGYGRNRTGRRT